jgi:hypothetical protein
MITAAIKKVTSALHNKHCFELLQLTNIVNFVSCGVRDKIKE